MLECKGLSRDQNLSFMPNFWFCRNRYVQAASDDLSQSSSSTEPQEDDAESKSVRAVDREIEEILNSTNGQSEDLAVEEEDDIQETSTEESLVKYDELR